MKNKKITYLLVPLVLLVWGLVANELLSGGLEDEVSTIEIDTSRHSNIAPDTAITQNYNLIADYRDPFLDETPIGNYKRTTRPTKIIKPKRSQQIKKSTNQKWPEVRYGGTIRNKNSNDIIAILTVDQDEMLLTVNQKLNGVQIQMIHQDSVLVSFNDQQKVIRKVTEP